jgi:hypothetical protein
MRRISGRKKKREHILKMEVVFFFLHLGFNKSIIILNKTNIDKSILDVGIVKS